MAVEETLYKNAMTIKLNNGTDSSGNIQTVDTTLGSTLSPSSWDAEKAWAIRSALLNVLSLEPYGTYRTATFAMTQSS